MLFVGLTVVVCRMRILKDHVLVRYDSRKRKLILDYVHSGARLRGNTALLTEFPVDELLKVSIARAARRVGEVLFIVLAGTRDVLLADKSVAKKRTRKPLPKKTKR